MSTQRNTAAVILIGDELLSGKVTDVNGTYMIRELRRLGVELTELHIVADRIEAIIEILGMVRPRNTYVFTSGGVGPTHDDRTMEAIGRVVDEPLEEHADLVDLIRQHFGEDPNTPWLKMAKVPRSCELLYHESTRWPAYKVHNIFILPGVPEIFQKQFDHIVENQLATGAPFLLRVLYLSVGEGIAAPSLTLASVHFEGVAIGSYPLWDHPDYRLRVTLEAATAEVLDTVTEFLRVDLAQYIVASTDDATTI